MKIHNRYPTEAKAQKAFIEYCDKHPDCRECPMNTNMDEKGWSCALHWVYGRYDQNALCRENGRPESKTWKKKDS